MIVEIVDVEGKVAGLLPEVRAMVRPGLITVEQVYVIPCGEWG